MTAPMSLEEVEAILQEENRHPRIITSATDPLPKTSVEILREYFIRICNTLTLALKVVEAAKKVQRYYHGKIDETQGALSELDEILKPFQQGGGGL